MLKKLEMRAFVSSQEDRQKQTKGARGQVYSILPDGKSALLHAIETPLSECREYDPRFNIALSGLGNIAFREAGHCLKTRRSFLATELERLVKAEECQTDLPMPAILLFDHIKDGIRAEITWLKKIIAKLEKMDIRNDDDT